MSKQADVTWVNREPPHFLLEDVDGRVCFEHATEKWKAQQEGRDRGLLKSRRPFGCFTEQGIIWPDGSQDPIDAVIWCTRFRLALDH